MSDLQKLEQGRAAIRFAAAKVRKAPVWDKAAAVEQLAEAVIDVLEVLIDSEIQRQQEEGVQSEPCNV